MKKYLLIFIMCITLISCTANDRAKSFGGTMEIEVKKGEKFINITWKDADMWILTKDTLTGKYYFREYSSLGILSGEVVINE